MVELIIIIWRPAYPGFPHGFLLREKTALYRLLFLNYVESVKRRRKRVPV